MNRIVKAVLGVTGFLVVMLVIAMLLGWYLVHEESQKTAALEKIENTHIILDDVMGKNLPPKPDQQENDKTIAGIDANNNTIRDDVERAIFEKYPNSPKTRAGMLQYAQALQLGLLESLDIDTYRNILQKEDYASLCITKSATDLKSIKDRMDDVENLIFDTDLRKRERKRSLAYMNSYSTSAGIDCDIDLSNL